MKKLVLLLTVILLALCLTSCGEEKSANGFDYTVNSDGKTCTITGIDSDLPEWLEIFEDWGWIDGNSYYNANLTIPKKLDGYTVTKIGSYAFEGHRSLTSIVIPDSVTSIGNWAFYYCSSLTSVVIPDGVTRIGESAFAYCYSLTSIVIPDSVTSIGDYAFRGCSSLTSIVIPDGVTSIGDYAFKYCNSLTSVVIPNSVKNIGNSAFYGCENLTSTTITNSMLNIGLDTFLDCCILESIKLSNDVTNIDFSTFVDFYSLIDIKVDEKNNEYKSINGNLYTKDGTTLVMYARGKIDSEFIIPSDVTNIGAMAIYLCENITTIIIPESVACIDYAAFSCCPNLSNIDVHKENNNYQSIDGNLYSKDGKILLQYAIGKTEPSFIIPNEVTDIDMFAFVFSQNLTSVVIPDGITTINYGVFSFCYNLNSVVVPNSLVSIGEDVFLECNNLYIIYNNSNLNLTIGDESYGGIAENAKVIVNKYGSISHADDGNKYILTDDGFLFRYKQGEYTLIAYDGRESKVTLPEKVNGSTYSLEEIKACEIVLPEGVTSIEANSFSSILKNITIPASVTSIDAEAFKNCTRLKNIEVSEENTVYKSIDGNLYTKDGKTLVKYAVGKTDRQFIIPDEMVEISIDTPEDLRYIESVVIHNGVTNIADSAFSGCNYLEYVYFTGTQEEWKKVVIGSNNDYLIEAIIVYEYVAEE